MSDGRPTVFVVDDDPAMRESLRWLIEAAEYRVETFDSAQAFLKAYRPDRSGCLVLDITMPDMSGLQLQERLNELGSILPIIIITGHGTVASAVRAMRSGALDLLEKPFSNDALLDNLRRAIQRDAIRRGDAARRSEIDNRLALLSPREREVLERIVAGKPNKAIAMDLKLSVKTIEAHRAHVMEKMRADSLAQLVQMFDLVMSTAGKA